MMVDNGDGPFFQVLRTTNQRSRHPILLRSSTGSNKFDLDIFGTKKKKYDVFFCCYGGEHE
jgi:hypothetical protein